MSSNTCTYDYKSDYFTLLALDASSVSLTLHHLNVRGQFVIFWCCLYIQSHNSGILQPLFIFRCSHL